VSGRTEKENGQERVQQLRAELAQWRETLDAAMPEARVWKGLEAPGAPH
jgi:hypothetical protein